jgi:hypothetical protein
MFTVRLGMPTAFLNAHMQSFKYSYNHTCPALLEPLCSVVPSLQCGGTAFTTS